MGNSREDGAGWLREYVAVLLDRVKYLEVASHPDPSSSEGSSSLGAKHEAEAAAIRRVKESLIGNSCPWSSQFKWTPPYYYSLSLSERAKLLGCRERQLCKVLILENRLKRDPQDCSDVLNSKYYMVLIQYVSKLQDYSLRKLVSELKPEGERLPRSQFNFQVAAEEEVLEMVGFEHNGVCPFGCVVNIPHIVAEDVVKVKEKYIWLGGGHPYLKLGISVEDFIRAAQPVAIAPITSVR